MSEAHLPHTPVGVSDDGFSTTSWRTTAGTWLWVLAIGMTLPRVTSTALWTSFSNLGISLDDVEPLLNVLQAFWLGASVTGLVALARLSVLDPIAEVGATGRLRRAALLLLVSEMGLRIVMPLVAGHSAWMVATAASVAGDTVMAVWLTRILRHTGHRSGLVVVVVINGAAELITVVPWPLRIVLGLVVTVWLLVDIVRVRRAIA